MEKSRLYIIIAAIGISILAAVTLFYPVSQARLISAGIDTYSAHRPLFGTRQLTQTIPAHYPITGLGFILVDMRHSRHLSSVTVTIRSIPQNEILLQKSIPAQNIRDDSFARLKFDEPLIHPDAVTVTVSAPDATPETPIGVRTDPDAQITPYTLSENGVARKGSLALEVLEEVPAWQAFLTAAARYQDSWSKTAFAAGAVLLVGILAFYYPRPTWTAMRTKTYQSAILAVLAIAALLSRTPVISSLSGVSGGDPYNYLLIAQSLAHLESPFNEGEKRLPGYPLLLVPAVLSPASDDHSYMRITSALAGVASLIMVALLARNLKLPWPVQVTAPILIAWQKDFFATSIRPEPYTFYTFLLLACLVLFFSQRKVWQEILFSVLLGWAALTRQEGFVLAALLGFAWFLLLPAKTLAKQSLSAYKPYLFSFLRMFLPALVIVSPFFIHNTREYGNPFTTPYFEGERLQIVNSWEAFKDNTGSTWGVIGSLWRPSWDELERYPITGMPVLAGALITLIWWALNSYLPAPKKKDFFVIALFISTLSAVAFILLTLVAKNSLSSIIPGLFAGIVLASPIPFLIHTGRRGIVVLIIGLSQLLVATWFHPFAKHYQQALPLIALMMCTAWIVSSSKEQKTRLSAFTRGYTACIVLFLPTTWLLLLLYSSLYIMVDKQNANAALDSVTYRAVRFALEQEGPYGFDQAYLPARLYLGNEGNYFYDDTSTPQEETQWLKDHGVRTLITTNDGRTFPTPHADWQELTRFRAAGKDEQILESIIYRIPSL